MDFMEKSSKYIYYQYKQGFLNEHSTEMYIYIYNLYDAMSS